jgi:hypothetical protein
MNRTLTGLVVAALGIALAAISALANQLEIGKHGFGWKQITGIIVGVVIAIAGAAVAAAPRARRRQRP